MVGYTCYFNAVIGINVENTNEEEAINEAIKILDKEIKEGDLILEYEFDVAEEHPDFTPTSFTAVLEKWQVDNMIEITGETDSEKIISTLVKKYRELEKLSKE